MAKKRKTRKEKERAAARKQARAKMGADSAVEGVDSGDHSQLDDKAQAQAVEAINSPEDLERHKERMGTMKFSLIVFGVLITVQIGLWGLEYLGLISLDFISL